MPKGYLVANIRVTDAEKFQAFAGCCQTNENSHRIAGAA